MIAISASRLRALRKKAGLTLREVSQISGYSASHLSNVERGEKRPAEGLVRSYEALAYGNGRRRVPQPPSGVPAEPGDLGGELDDDFGTRLMRLRIVSGRSLVQAADRIHISRSHLGNLETGRRRPTADVAKACDAAFGASGALIVLALEAHSHRETEPPAQRAPRSSAAKACLSLDPGEVLEMCTVSFRRWRAAGQHERPRDLVADLVVEANHVAEVASAAGRGTLQDDLWMLAARYAEFVGWMFQEAAQDASAERWTKTATDWATRAGDHDMASYAWERRALTALYNGDAEATVALARRAGECNGVSPRVLGLAARREAQGHALGGDKGAYQRALDRSRALLSQGPAPYPNGVSWGPNTISDSSMLIEASSLVDLRCFGEAAELFDDESCRSAQQVPPRTRARFAVKQSLALLGSGDIDRARDVLDSVLPSIARVDSATIRCDMRRLLNGFNRRRSHPRAASALPNIHNVLRPR
jgi:transcriptional regulator with XRE-family HTH domain